MPRARLARAVSPDSLSKSYTKPVFPRPARAGHQASGDTAAAQSLWGAGPSATAHATLPGPSRGGPNEGPGQGFPAPSASGQPGCFPCGPAWGDVALLSGSVVLSQGHRPLELSLRLPCKLWLGPGHSRARSCCGTAGLAGAPRSRGGFGFLKWLSPFTMH